jgi:hypothetical protein
VGVAGKGRRLPLDQGGEVVHAMCAGGELRGHVLGLAVTRLDEIRIWLKGKARFRQGGGCCCA